MDASPRSPGKNRLVVKKNLRQGFTNYFSDKIKITGEDREDVDDFEPLPSSIPRRGGGRRGVTLSPLRSSMPLAKSTIIPLSHKDEMNETTRSILVLQQHSTLQL